MTRQELDWRVVAMWRIGICIGIIDMVMWLSGNPSSTPYDHRQDAELRQLRAAVDLYNQSVE